MSEEGKKTAGATGSEEDIVVKDKFLSKPCVRQSLINGITGGVFLSLGHFGFTSRSHQTIPVFAVGYTLISIGSYGYCQYKRIQEEVQWRRTVAEARRTSIKQNSSENCDCEES